MSRSGLWFRCSLAPTRAWGSSRVRCFPGYFWERPDRQRKLAAFVSRLAGFGSNSSEVGQDLSASRADSCVCGPEPSYECVVTHHSKTRCVLYRPRIPPMLRSSLYSKVARSVSCCGLRPPVCPHITGISSCEFRGIRRSRVGSLVQTGSCPRICEDLRSCLVDQRRAFAREHHRCRSALWDYQFRRTSSRTANSAPKPVSAAVD